MSDDVVIRVENLSLRGVGSSLRALRGVSPTGQRPEAKQYRIGGTKEGYKTIRETLVDATKAPFQRLKSAYRVTTITNFN